MKVLNSVRHDQCPLCRSERSSKIGNLNYFGGAKFSTEQIELACVPELWKCNECQSCFVQNTVDDATARILYSTSQAGERWSTLPFDQCKTIKVIETMAAMFKDKGSVLDVGCNTGELLDFAQDFGCRTSGVEYSAASCEVLSGKGHIAHSLLVEAPGNYDVIAAFDLFEHLYDPTEFMKSCRDKLSENAKLVILTGNIQSLSAKLAGARWWYAQYPEHIVFPSRKYFSEYSGMKIEKWLLTYASKGYQNSINNVALGMLKGVLRGRAYTGLPSVGPDHVLIVLSK